MATGKIVRYPVMPHDFVLYLPDPVQIIRVDVAHGLPNLWVFIDPELPVVETHFTVIESWEEIDLSKWLAWHVGNYTTNFAGGPALTTFYVFLLQDRKTFPLRGR